MLDGGLTSSAGPLSDPSSPSSRTTTYHYHHHHHCHRQDFFRAFDRETIKNAVSPLGYDLRFAKVGRRRGGRSTTSVVLVVLLVVAGL